MAKRNHTRGIVAEIALYGSHENAGWLAQTANGDMMGDGELLQGRTLTEAIWLACREITAAGYTTGKVRVFAPSGYWQATTDLNLAAYYGNLVWEKAIVYAISAKEILAHAETPA